MPIVTKELCLHPSTGPVKTCLPWGRASNPSFVLQGAEEAAGLCGRRGEGGSSGAIAPLPGGAIQLLSYIA